MFGKSIYHVYLAKKLRLILIYRHGDGHKITLFNAANSQYVLKQHTPIIL